MRAAVGIALALGACTPAAQSGILPAFVGIPVAAQTQLSPDCTYWNQTEPGMQHAPAGASCVSFAVDQTQNAINAYSAELDHAGWRVVDQFGAHRLYEKTISQGCTQRIDVTVYPTTSPNEQPSNTDVIVFAPHDGPVCTSYS